MSDSLYVNDNGTPVPLNLGAGIEYVQRIEALEAYAGTQATKDAAQDEAISSAKSSADAAKSSADAAKSSADAAKSSADALSDGNGFSDAGRGTIVGWGMPDYSAGIDILSTVSTTSTQDRSYPYDCFLYVLSADNAVSGRKFIVKIDDHVFSLAGYTYNGASLLIPIRKDRKFRVYYEVDGPNAERKAIIYPTIGG